MKSISCKDAVTLILKKEEGKLSLRQRLSLWRHLAICNLCRIFSSQNHLMNLTMKSRQHKQTTLSQVEKETILRNVVNQRND